MIYIDLYGFTRVWEWFHWIRVEILRNSPIQMPPELWYGAKSGLQLFFSGYLTCPHPP